MGRYYRPSSKSINAAAALFAIYHNGFANFCNKLRGRMYYESRMGAHLPELNGSYSLTNLNILFLLSEGIELAAMNGWIQSDVTNIAPYFRDQTTCKSGVSHLEATLQRLSMMGNLEQAMSVAASIQTSVLTLPVTGPLAGKAGTALNVLFTGESVGEAALSTYLSVGVDQAVQDFIAALINLK